MGCGVDRDDHRVEQERLIEIRRSASRPVPIDAPRNSLPDEVLYPPSAGEWVHIVRLEGREERICAVYDDIEEARANMHRHQFNVDEIVSFVRNEKPLLYDSEGLLIHDD